MRLALLVGTIDGVVPPSDRAAVGLAVRRLGPGSGPGAAAGSIEAWSLRDDPAALRYARGAGAAAAPVATAAALDRLAFDVALVGQAGAQPWGDLLPALLAERRGAALVLDVLDVAPSPEGLHVTRDLGRGAREELWIEGPAVLAVSPDAPVLHYVSRHRQRAASPPAGPDRAGLADPLAAASGPWEPVRPRARATAPPAPGSPTERLNALLGADAPAREGTAHVVAADARTCARHLVRFLAQLGVVERAPAREAAGEVPARAEGAPVAVPGRRPAPGAPTAAVPGPRAGAPAAAGGEGDPAVLARLARGPRSPGAARAARLRGPFPVPPASPAGPARDPAAAARLARGPRSLDRPRAVRLTGPFPAS